MDLSTQVVHQRYVCLTSLFFPYSRNTFTFYGNIFSRTHRYLVFMLWRQFKVSFRGPSISIQGSNQDFQQDGTVPESGTKGQKFPHCLGTKGQWDKPGRDFDILSQDRLGQDFDNLSCPVPGQDAGQKEKKRKKITIFEKQKNK